MFSLVCFEAPASQNKPSAARTGAERLEGDASPKTTPEKINRFAWALTSGLVDVGRVNMQNSGKRVEVEEDRREISGCTMRQSLHGGCFQDSSTAERVEEEVKLPCGVFPLTTPRLT